MEADWTMRNAERLKREAEEKKREEERKKREEEQEKKRKAEEKKHLDEKFVWRRKKHRAIINSIRKYDPKAKNSGVDPIPLQGLLRFRPRRVVRFSSDAKYQQKVPTNVLRSKYPHYQDSLVRCWLPIDVYGTAIARDNLDFKCVYLFRCHRRDSQLIKSEDESLILTGPARGLILSDFIYLEVDLKIKGARGQDKQLSKELLEIDGRKVTRLEKNEVMQPTCACRLSAVEVKYTVVKNAVEAIVEIHVIWGYFCGQISAHTSSILDEFVLFKGETGGVFTNDGSRIIPLWRRVVNVCLTDKLIFTIENRDGTKLIIESTPATHGSDCYECPFGSEKFRVKVTWSAT